MILKTIRAGAAIVGLLFAPMGALAADLPRPSYKTPVYVEPIFNWTGFYVGVNAGYGWAQSKWSGGAGNFEVAPHGWLGGGTLGYNYQTAGGWVLGLEGDIDYMNLKGTADAAFCAGCSFKNTWLGTVRGRLGYAMGHWFPYITAGGAYGNMYIEAPGGSATKTKAGWTAGVGFEYALAGGWSTKLEYLYVDLGSTSCGSAVCLLPADASVDFKANLVRAGLNYRF